MIDPNSPYITATATKIENPETDCDVDELTQDDRNQCLLDKYGDTSEFSLAVPVTY
jgi:hypothetical protein